MLATAGSGFALVLPALGVFDRTADSFLSMLLTFF
jgi:hypothetical protein